MTRFLAAIVSVLAVLLLPAWALADGFIIVEHPHHVPGHFPFAPMEVSYHHVDVAIDDAVAVTSVDQEFYNPSAARTVTVAAVRPSGVLKS